MTLIRQFCDALRAASGPQTVSVSEGPRTGRCTVSEVTSLAVNVELLILETPELAAVTVSQLQKLGQDLSDRVSYLLEPIGPIEIDADACSVQMRSTPPQKDDDGRNYYELFVKRGGAISLQRFRKESGQPRAAIPATLTRE